MYRCGFLIIEQTAQNIRKGHTTSSTAVLLLLVGCKQVLLRARNRAGRVFRNCGVGVGGALVARCVCVWGTARRSPTNVRRAF